MENVRVRLGDILLSNNFITIEQLEKALDLQKSGTNKRLGEILIEQGYISEHELLVVLSQKLGLPVVNINIISVDVATATLIPKVFCLKYHLIAIKQENNSITIAVNDPLNFYAIEDVKSLINMPCNIVLAKKDEIIKAINASFSESEARNAVAVANQSTNEKRQRASVAAEEVSSPVVDLINSILMKAYHEGASDIHLEPFENVLKVRLRIDGMLVDYIRLETDIAGQISTRIKIMSELDIAERRIPQDGHFKVGLAGTEMNIRVSTMPTVFGEKIVLRFLNMSAAVDNALQYGMTEDNFLKVSRILHNPYGILLITGPTGSGKTTTLYMILDKMSNEPINISTIEDPVEKNLPNVNQVQINPPAGLTFESGLRSMLRQDPDVILVGETRDAQTASIAVSAALTGHLVLTTLHTNDAVSAIVRLADMGIEDYLLANSVIGIVAQRLIKKICPYCKTPYTPDEKTRLLILDAEALYKGKGCPHCNHTGYKGRVAVHEILEIDKEIRKMISTHQPMENIYSYARENNKLVFIRDNIIQLVREGVTTAEELIRQTAFEV
ncbi:MAG: GspE/PulE family protein [Christensenellales bacterium]